MTYTPIQRNFDNIQFAGLRKKVDPKFNTVHDELSDCYYNKKSFRNYGILNKNTFDKLHGLIFHLRYVDFYQESLKQPMGKKILKENNNEKRLETAFNRIAQLKKEMIELII